MSSTSSWENSSRSVAQTSSRSPRSPRSARSPRSPRTATRSSRSRSPVRSPRTVVEEVVDAVMELGPYHLLTEEMESVGWVPVGEVVTEDGNLHYIRAVTPQGFEAFVLVDGQGDLPRSGRKVYQLLSNSDAVVASASYKKSAMKVGDDCGCGMALVCTEGVCMMTRNEETMDVEETNFAVVSPFKHEYGVEGDDILPIPIIYYSDVLSDHALQEAKVLKAQGKLSLEAFGACMETQEEMIKAHEVFDEIAREHKKVYALAWANLLGTTKKVREARSGFPGSLAEMNPNTAELIRNVSIDLDRRTELMQDLLRTCGMARDMERQLKAMSEKLSKQILYLVDNFNEKVLSKDVN